MKLHSIFLILAITQHRVVFGSPRIIPPPSITPFAKPYLPNFLAPEEELRKRQVTDFEETCGYYDGNRPRTADAGWDCRVDTKNALWGFCPATVISASDCGLAGNCKDSHKCSKGCGMLNRPDITTFSWYVDIFPPSARSASRKFLNISRINLQ